MTVWIAGDVTHETLIKKSRFICDLTRAASEEKARAFIAAVKKAHPKANHHCSAFIIGEGGSAIERSSDDGEPSGTAGVPMLEVMRKRGVSDICAMVTRYFGGVKLGAGGLIRAYAGAVAQALDEAGLVQLVTQQELQLTLDYALYDSLRHFLSERELATADVEFSAEIILSVFVVLDSVDDFLHSLTERFGGKIRVEKKDGSLVEMPLSWYNSVP